MALRDQIIPIDILQRLTQQNIKTIFEFIQEDSEKLSQICLISFKDIVDLKQNLISKYSADPQRGDQIYEKVYSVFKNISTGVKSFDNLLNGGLLIGNIYEICGFSGDGKTQFCLTIAANITHYLKQKIYYIDTKSDFNSHRLLEILSSRGLTTEECTAAMNLVQVVKVKDLNQLITYLDYLKNILSAPNNGCRLVIIESMPALFFHFLGDNEGSYI
uniref:RecA family profile 1 domain-containing protein n=1 Tax=Clastoptera arizonana TaxID=38151 RepID=A0A1B6CJZ7_9HEMI